MAGWFAARPYRFNSAFRIRASPEATDPIAGASGDRSARPSRPASPRSTAPPVQATSSVRHAGGAAARRNALAGGVYVLINRNSFSNAVAVAATIQDYRFGTILGEETSDLATTYGAMETFTLPGTGIKVGFPKARIVRPSGDPAPRGVLPDIAIATPVIEGRGHQVLRRAVEIVSEP